MQAQGGRARPGMPPGRPTRRRTLTLRRAALRRQHTRSWKRRCCPTRRPRAAAASRHATARAALMAPPRPARAATPRPAPRASPTTATTRSGVHASSRVGGCTLPAAGSRGGAGAAGRARAAVDPGPSRRVPRCRPSAPARGAASAACAACPAVSMPVCPPPPCPPCSVMGKRIFLGVSGRTPSGQAPLAGAAVAGCRLPT